jgi:hypothetical protein
MVLYGPERTGHLGGYHPCRGNLERVPSLKGTLPADLPWLAGWVCESHPRLACECGTGRPRPVCNLADTPQTDPDFVPDDDL